MRFGAARLLQRATTRTLAGMTRAIALPAVWLIGVVAIALSGIATDQYLLYVRGIPEPHPYPLEGVALFAAVATVECMVAWAILRPSSYARSWLRALFAGLFAAGALAFFAMGLMHSPLYMFVHALWLAVCSLALMALTVWSAVRAIRIRNAS